MSLPHIQVTTHVCGSKIGDQYPILIAIAYHFSLPIIRLMLEHTHSSYLQSTDFLDVAIQYLV
jgi:hypothetical protein